MIHTYHNKVMSPHPHKIALRRNLATTPPRLPLPIPLRTRRSYTDSLPKFETTPTLNRTVLLSRTASHSTKQNRTLVRFPRLMTLSQRTPTTCSGATGKPVPAAMLATMTAICIMERTAVLTQATMATPSSTTLPVRTTTATVRATDPTSQERCVAHGASLSLTRCTPPRVTEHGLKKCFLTSNTPRPVPELSRPLPAPP